MSMFRGFRKHKYIRVVKFNSDKTTNVIYLNRTRSFDGTHIEVNKKKYMINSEHVFNNKGYQSVLITDKNPETINPLKMRSNFKMEDYQSAINSKIIGDTFDTMKSNTIDVTKLLLLGNLIFSVIILYFLIQQSGMLGG